MNGVAREVHPQVDEREPAQRRRGLGALTRTVAAEPRFSIPALDMIVTVLRILRLTPRPYLVER